MGPAAAALHFRRKDGVLRRYECTVCTYASPGESSTMSMTTSSLTGLGLPGLGSSEREQAHYVPGDLAGSASNVCIDAARFNAIYGNSRHFASIAVLQQWPVAVGQLRVASWEPGDFMMGGGF